MAINHVNYSKLVHVFVVTAIIFMIAIISSRAIGEKKVIELNKLGDKLYVDILALETHFNLLQDLSCEKIVNSPFKDELGAVGEKLTFAESRKNIDRTELDHLKKYYAVLQIKDFLLMKNAGQKCGFDPNLVLYFYSSNNDCDDCRRQGYVLTYFKELYPGIRLHALDYNLDMSALKTLIDVYGIEKNLPALLIDNVSHYGFKSVDDMTMLMPHVVHFSKSEVQINNHDR